MTEKRTLTIKAAWAIVVAAVMGFVAWLVGKSTPQLWAARLKATEASRQKNLEALKASLEARRQVRHAEDVARRMERERAKTYKKLAELDKKAVEITEHLLRAKERIDADFADDFNSRLASHHSVH